MKYIDVWLVIIRMVMKKVILGQQGKVGKRWIVTWKNPPLGSLLPSTQAPLLFPNSIPRLDSKSPILHLFLADSPDIVRLLVPLPDSPGSSPGGFSPSFFPPVPPPNRIQTHSVPISSTHISLLCVSLLFLQKRGFILKILLHLFIGTQQFIIIFLKGQTSIQEGIHFNCSISKASSGV